MRNVMDGSITNNHTGTELRPHLVTMQNLDKLHFKDIQQILTFTNNLIWIILFCSFGRYEQVLVSYCQAHVFSVQALRTAAVIMVATAPPRPRTPVSAGDNDDNL